MIIDSYLTVSERMGSGDNVVFDQRFKALNRSVKPALYLKPSPPVLLPFPAQDGQPPTFGFFCRKTGKNGSTVSPKPSPMGNRTHRVYSAAVRASPPFHPQRIGYPVEESIHISMAPDTIAVAANTSSRTRPAICFPKYL